MTTTDNYTWADFKAVVMTMLTVDATRSGIESYRDAMIRQAVIDVQGSIKGYTIGHETIYNAADFVTEGMASRGVKPPQSNITSVHICKICTDSNLVPCRSNTCTRFLCDPYKWEDRFNLINGYPSVNNGRALIAIDPGGYEFVIYPEIRDCYLVSINWNGKKLCFLDNEEVPFDEQMAMTVAEFVSAKIERKVNRDPAMHDSFMNDVRLGKGKLYVNMQEKRSPTG